MAVSTEPEIKIENYSDPDVHLRHLLIEGVETPWYTMFLQNIREAINPPKLPPLELTSKPVEVESMWGLTKGQESKAGVMSLVVHGTLIALAIFIGTNKTVQKAVKDTVTLIAPDISPYVAQKPQMKQAMGGGGGGGDRSPLPASKGKLPPVAPKQFVPPSAVLNNENPKLPMEPTIVAPDSIPNIQANNFGDPMSKFGIPSNGSGFGGGIGSGSGGGVGSGRGAGVGPGSGGGFGGGAYRIGGGVSAPAVLLKVEPEYSEEARKAKWQGTVVLAIVVDEQGRARDLKVIRSLGLGLDQKAIEAVEKWRFKPGMKDGKPVPVQATIEVNFRLL